MGVLNVNVYKCSVLAGTAAKITHVFYLYNFYNIFFLGFCSVFGGKQKHSSHLTGK